jgi:hypothetical protein
VIDAAPFRMELLDKQDGSTFDSGTSPLDNYLIITVAILT